MGNFIDNMVSYFNPVAGLRRTQARLTQENIERKYDIAARGRRNSFGFRKTTAAQEVSKAFDDASANAQELTRNNPLARRAKRVLGNNAVSGGIKADVTGDAKKKIETFVKRFEKWAESTDCDFEEHYDFYGLQWLWVVTLVESGGFILRKHINKANGGRLEIQTIEPSHLDRTKATGAEEGKEIIDGIQYDKETGKREGLWLLTEPTNTKLGRVPESKFYSNDEVIYRFDKERAGQHLGITTFQAVATTLKDYSTYTDAKLMQQQIAACFALLIENADQQSGVGIGSGTTELPDAIEPAMIEYVKSGANVHTVTPPKADNSSAFDSGLKHDMAAGSGVTHEQLTGDFSKVNFASGRMARVEFYLELDHIQQHVLKPALDKVFEWFCDFHAVKHGNVECDVTWTYPPRAAVNPMEEIDIIVKKTRNGLMSPSKAAKLLGEKLPKIIEQWKKDKDLFGELPFDIDPSMFSAAGNQLDDNDAASGNKKDEEDSATE